MRCVENEFAYVSTPDGHQIATWCSIPYKAQTILVLCHGITVDSTEGGLFIAFERILLNGNLGAVRFDFRCHGQSTGEPKDLTLHGEYLDLKGVIQHVEDKWDLPLVVLATSFSCSAVMKNITERSAAYNGLILWNPIVDYSRTFLEESTPWAASILETTSDPDLPSWAYARIPNTAYFITKELAAEFRADDTPVRLQNLDLPAIAFHGNRDTKVPYVYLEEIAQKNRTIEFHLLDGERHGFKGQRDWVMEKTVSWVRSMVDAL